MCKNSVKKLYLVFSILFSISLFSYYKPDSNGITFVVNGVDIRLIQGDITCQCDIDAIVNPANQHFKKGGGACGAIFRSAGSRLDAICIRALNNFKEQRASAGTVVVTEGCDLNINIIHVVAPNFNSTNFVQKSILFDDVGKNILEKSYFNLLNLALKEGFERVAIPFLSGGNFCRVPSDKNELAAIALESVVYFCKNNLKDDKLKEVRFVLYDVQDFEIFAKELDSLVN